MGKNAIGPALAFAFALAAAPAAWAQASPVAVEAGKPLPPKAMQAIERMIAAGTSGVTVVYGDRRGEISRVRVGKIEPGTQYPIASASKWLTAAVVMALVDEGKLSLDLPVSTWLPQATGATGAVTLRQLLAQTSGLSGTLAELYDLKQEPGISLAQSADEVLGRPLAHAPGSQFHYGGPGFQVVGAVVEAVTGQTWGQVFDARIARPLDMRGTYWMHLRFGEAPPPSAITANPVLQGGAVSTADDYARFLNMLANGGRFQGRRVLSARAVAEMLRDQTATAQMNSTNAALLQDAHYSLGNWCETWEKVGDTKAACTRSSSIGAFGAYPWLDRPSGRYGLIFINRQQDAFAVWPETQAVQAALTEAGGR